MQTKHKLFLALASTTLAVVACGGSSSSSNDESSSTSSTGGAGGSSGAGGAGGAGDSGAGGTSPGTTVSASSSAANSVGGSGGSNAATTTVDAGSGATTSLGGAGGTSGAAGAPDGSDSGGTSSAGGVGGSGGSGGTRPTGMIGVLGEPCDSPGELACAGNHQKLTVVCGGDGAWEVNETCGATEYCDSAAGDTTGLCIEPTEPCAELAPGDVFCSQGSVVACNVDGLRTTEVEECTTPCSDGACEQSGAPCPTEEFVNCSSQCGEFECYETECIAAPILSLYLDEVGDSIVLRTGAYAELCGQERCEDGVRGLQVIELGLRVRYTVDAPWGIVSGDRLAEDSCAERRACEIVEPEELLDTLVVWVETSDASAGAANLVAEVVDEEATCP